MTVSSGYAPNSSTGNGVTTVFPYNFRIFAAADLEVSVDGVVKTLTTDYSVSGVGAAGGGNVTFVAAPANGTTVIRRRNMALVRTTDYQDNGDLLADVLNPDQDAPVMMAQQLQEQISRSLKFPLGDAAATTLPSATARAGTALVFDGSGNIALSAPVADLSAALTRADADASTAAAQAAIATTQSGIATTQAGVASGQAAIATTQASVATTQAGIAAGWAATAALNVKFYDTIALGRAAVADTVTFGVKPGGSDGLTRPTIYRRDSSTTQTLIGSFVSGSEYDALFPQLTPTGYAWAVLDGVGHAAFGVKDDGTVDIKAATVDSLTVVGGTTSFQISPSGNVWEVLDAGGNVALAVERTGKVRWAGDRDADTRRGAGRYTRQVIYFNNAGQSLAVGPSPAITVSQSYDNLRTDSEAFQTTQFIPAVGLGGEPPMLGAMEMIKQLIEQENGIAYGANDYVLIGDNQGSSGSRLDQINKGNAKYSLSIANLTFAKADFPQRGGDLRKTVGAGATFFTQGESDQNVTAEATYTARLIQYATDFDTDSRAITGQLNPVPLICYQTHAHEAVDGPRIGLALLEAHKQSPLIYMATPIYFLTYLDGLHIDAVSSKWLGAYYGLVYKRVVIDGLDWEPLRPVNHSVVGNTITLGFTKGGLTLDTATVPAQTNYGFTLRDAGGSPVAISSVQIVGSERVRITAASAPASGWKVQYGNNNSTGIGGSYVAGAGNLRDKAGDALVYLNQNKPMHNWCVFFNYEI